MISISPGFNFYVQTLVHDKHWYLSFLWKNRQDKAICCDLCIKWIHIRCKKLNDLDYEYLKSNDETWYCKTCIQKILPFCNKKINPNKINLGDAGIDPNLKNLSEKGNIDNENLYKCKYRDVSYFSNLDVELKSKCLLFFHLNINSLSKNFDNCNHLINNLIKIKIWYFERFRVKNFKISIFKHKCQFTKSTAWGALLYINKKHSCKTGPDIAIYQPKKL